MYKNDEIWKQIQFMTIKNEIYEISSYGRLRSITSGNIYEPDYHSTNGFDYGLFMTTEDIFKLYPIDLIVAATFISIPKELIKANLVLDVIHIDDDNRNNNIKNLKWVKFEEKWCVIENDNLPIGVYSISNMCHIRNNLTGKLLAFNKTHHGYLRINLPTSNSLISHKLTYSAHRLVAKAFVPGYTPEKNQVNHINGIKTHNVPRNLEWMSNRENFNHAISTGLKKTIITDSDADIISQELIKQNGNTYGVFNELHDKIPMITYNIINNIKYKGSWAYISDKYFDNKYFKIHKYSNKDDIHRICQSLINHNGSIKEVIDELKNDITYITNDVVSHIKFKQTWVTISDLYFKKDQFRTVLNTDEVKIISELILKYNGDTNKVYNDIITEIPFINKNTICAIYNKKNFSYISDNYFSKYQFK